MQSDWVLVYSTDQMYKALFMKERLLEEGIGAFIINKRDSLYAFGDIEIYVNSIDAVKSIYIIKNGEFE
jgi:hypothetical protein